MFIYPRWEIMNFLATWLLLTPLQEVVNFLRVQRRILYFPKKVKLNFQRSNQINMPLQSCVNSPKPWEALNRVNPADVDEPLGSSTQLDLRFIQGGKHTNAYTGGCFQGNYPFLGVQRKPEKENRKYCFHNIDLAVAMKTGSRTYKFNGGCGDRNGFWVSFELPQKTGVHYRVP